MTKTKLSSTFLELQNSSSCLRFLASSVFFFSFFFTFQPRFSWKQLVSHRWFKTTKEIWGLISVGLSKVFLISVKKKFRKKYLLFFLEVQSWISRVFSFLRTNCKKKRFVQWKKKDPRNEEKRGLAMKKKRKPNVNNFKREL